MLDAWIIEELLRKEREGHKQEQPQLPIPEMPQAPLEEKPEETHVIVIEI